MSTGMFAQVRIIGSKYTRNLCSDVKIWSGYINHNMSPQDISYLHWYGRTPNRLENTSI